MTRQFFLAATCSLMLIAEAPAEEASLGELRPVPSRSEWTELTKAAATLDIGMSIEEVVRRLGPPDFVTTSRDDREWYSFATRGYELFWKNGRCNAIEAQFPDGVILTGWDEGRVACGPKGKRYPSAFLPPRNYACEVRKLPPC